MSEETKKESAFSEADLKAKALEFLEKNPKVKVVHATDDGYLFLNRKFAADHAETLPGKQVHDFNNPLNMDVVAEEVTETTTGTGTSQDADVLKKLSELELTSKNYNEMKALVKALNIEVADQKADTFIKALEEYKAKNTAN